MVWDLLILNLPGVLLIPKTHRDGKCGREATQESKNLDYRDIPTNKHTHTQNPKKPNPTTQFWGIRSSATMTEICINITSQLNRQFSTEWACHSLEMSNSDKDTDSLWNLKAITEMWVWEKRAPLDYHLSLVWNQYLSSGKVILRGDSACQH